MRRALAATLLALWIPAAAAGQASAHAVMSIDGATIVYNGNDDISLNRLEISISGTSVRFFDPGSDGGIRPADGCNAGEVDGNGFIIEVLCPRAGRTAVRADVGDGADTVALTAPLNAVVLGGRGADVVTTSTGNDQVNGGDGNDRITTGAGNDTIRGEAGDDTLAGGEGNDTIQASVGIDEVSGDGGDDLLQVRDGVVDGVACGAGTDRVQADGNDVVRDGAACEAVETGQATPESAGTGTGTAPLPPVNGGSGGGGTSSGGGSGSGGTGSGSGSSSGTGPAGGGNAASPTVSTAGDRDAPRVRSGGSTLQRLSSSNKLTVLATTSEAAEVVGAGSITLGDRRIILTSSRRVVDVAGGGTILRLQVPKSATKAIRSALRARKPVRAAIVVVATDRAGNSSASKLPAVRLRR